ncbi:MAG: hypothetical protein ACOYXC_06765 [Candidatus Rifleibacteriota bacterium]
MSRSYSIRIPVEVLIPKGAGNHAGSFSLVFTLLDILPAPRMRELLQKELLAKGFSETEEGLGMPCRDGVTAVLDPVTMTMKLTVPMPESCTVMVYEEYLQSFREELARAMEAGQVAQSYQVASAVESMKAQVIAELKELASDARKEINSALKNVYSEAIREKAASLGNVENVTESREGNTYRIRIEIST